MTRRMARSFLLIGMLFVGILSVVAATFAQDGGYGGWPGARGDFRDTCGQDVRQFCSGVPPGGGRIIQCLASHRNGLSPACRSDLVAARAGGGAPSYGRNAYGPGRNPNVYGPAPNGYAYGPAPFDPYRRGAYGPGPDASGYGPDPDADMRPMRETRRYGPNNPTSSDPGESAGSIVTSDGRTRTYVIHTPTGISPSKTYPLVLLFHGGGGEGARVLSTTRFASKADQEGFIVVAPDGVNRRWDDGRGTANPGIDDVGFVRQLIADLKSRLPVDPKRIYATGLSNGGIFTQRLGCELSDTLAAIGPDAGPMAANLLSSCKPGPIAVVGIQGGADVRVPLEGGEMGEGTVGGIAASAAQTMKLWATVNGCNPSPDVANIRRSVNDGTRVVKYSYSGCTAGTNVEYYIVQGMGHGWPGALAMRINGPTSHNINATDVMWGFFKAHSR